MAILSSRMLSALEAAQAAGHLGLRYTVAGWVEDARPHAYHSFTTVSALIERGDLSRQRGLNAEGARCFVTPKGKTTLADARVPHELRPGR